MRAIRLIGGAARDLAAAVAAAILMYMLFHRLTPGAGRAIYAEILPVRAHRPAWVLVAVAMLLALWLGFRAFVGSPGMYRGACRWLVRIGLWWGMAALLLFIAVTVHGAFNRNLSDLHWRFALEYLILVLAFLTACRMARQRTSGAVPDRS